MPLFLQPRHVSVCAYSSNMIPTCPKCQTNENVREILYGMPSGPPDESKYVLGGCGISNSDPSYTCTKCGWEGEFINNVDWLDIEDDKE